MECCFDNNYSNNDTPHVVNEQQKLDQSTTTENDQTTGTFVFPTF